MTTVKKSNPTFDIRNFIEALTPSHKGANYYKCPVCNGSSLHINPSTGAYKCFSNECDNAAVREFVAPLGSKPTNKPQLTLTAPSGGAAIIPTDAPIALLPQPRPVSKGEYKGSQYQIRYNYSDNQFVVRYEYQKNGKREKSFTPHHLDSNGVVVAKKGAETWPLYGNQDIEKLGGGNWINEAEGEKNADYLASIGLVACSVTGTANEKDIRYGYQQAINSGIAGIIYHQDNDKPGENKSKKHQRIADDMGIPFIIIPAKELDPDIKEAGDIADLIADGKIDKDSLILFIENKIKTAAAVVVNKPSEANNILSIAVDNTKPSDDPLVTFNQIAIQLLYKELGYKCINGQLAKWEGNYYETHTDDDELTRISDFCNSYPVVAEQKDDKPKITYPFAKPKVWREVLECAKTRLNIGSKNIQTPGINFTNGVVKLDWSSDVPTPIFEKHDPEKHYFIAKPEVAYNPLADSTDCDKLLTCLDSKHREILLKVLSASLDLKEVRKRIGARKIRTLFLIGEGNNGKDTIRQTLTMILGNTHLTGVTLTNFMEYDKGNQFQAGSLIRSRINWPSETATNTTSIDQSPSLKSFTSGDPLYSEYKHKDAIPYTPEGICIFNLNNYPNLTGTTHASKTRFVPIPFKKTYVNETDFNPHNPDHALEDIRFKDNPDFIANNVAPAFFNRLIKELQDLILNDIDYSCTQETMQKIQFENNHLFEFSESIGLVAGNGAIRLNDIFSKLESYYKDQGILVVDDFNNRRWCDPVKPSDPYIKGVNNLFPKLKKLFPKIEKSKLTDPVSKRETTIIKGLQIIQKSDQTTFTSPDGVQLIVKPLKNNLDGLTTDSLRTHYDKIEPLPGKESKPSKPSKPTFSTFLKKIEITSYIVPENSQRKNNEKNLVTSEKTGFTGSPGCGSVDIQGVEELAKNESGSEVGLQGGKVGLQGGEVGGIVSDRTSLEALTSQIKVVDPREQKQQLFTQEQLAENQIIEDIKSQILRLDNAKDHLDLRHTLDFQDFKAFRAIRAWLIKGDMKSDGTKESILPREFVDIWLS